jgi:RNA recognition motif-containing protein
MPRLFIGNIPHASSDTALQQWVESRGFRVEAVEVIYDRATGRSRGFGFVTIGEGDIQTAIGVLNGQRMDGRVLTVSEAVPLSAPAAHNGDRRAAPAQREPISRH